VPPLDDTLNRPLAAKVAGFSLHAATYPDLLKRFVLEPVELHDTTIALAPDQERRFIAGYSANLRPAHAWDLVGLAGAGAIRSTADDMLRYLEKPTCIHRCPLR